MAETITNAVAIDCEYTNTDFVRRYKVSDVAANDLSSVETKINALNTSLAGGTAGGISGILISDDYDPAEGIGYLSRISKAIITSTQEIDVPF